MRNLRIIFASVLMMLSIGAAVGMEKHADLSIAIHGGTNGTWTPATNTYEWTKNNDSRVVITDIVGDLTEWTNLIVVTDGYTDSYRIDIKTLDGTVIQGTTAWGKFYSAGSKELVLTAGLTEEQIKAVEEIRINTNSNSGSIVIKDVYLKNDAPTPFTRTCSGFTTVKHNNNCYYNTATKNFSWTANSSNTMQIFEMPAGTLQSYKALKFTISDLTDGPCRVLFMKDDGTNVTKSFYNNGEKTINLNEVEDIASITSIRFAGQSAAGSVTIDPKSIYLTAEELSIVSPISGFEWYCYVTDTVYGHSQGELDKHVGARVAEIPTSSTVYGPYKGDGKTAYMDLTDYTEIEVITGNDGTAGLRFIYGENSNLWSMNTGEATTYTEDISSITKVGCVKTKKETGTKVQITAINFLKSFEPALSATPWTFMHDVENTAVTYDRTFTVGQPSTVYLPFDLTADQVRAAGKFYEFVNYDGTNVGFNPVATTKAYTPYLFIPSVQQPFANITTTIKELDPIEVTNNNATFKGVLQHVNDLVNTKEAGNTVYGYSAIDGSFVKAGNVSIDAFRAYIVIPGEPANMAPRLKVVVQKTPTAVENTPCANSQSTKLIRNGQLLILRDGKTYNMMGQIIE